MKVDFLALTGLSELAAAVTFSESFVSITV